MNPKLQRLQDVISRAIHGSLPKNLSRDPKGKWCAAEILEHLNLTFTGTIKNLERRLVSDVPLSADRSSKRWQRLVVTRLRYIPTGRKSPENVLPKGKPQEQVIAEILPNIERMDQLITDCESRFGKGRPIAVHPLLGPLTADEWRTFHLTHGRHHARQIARLRNLS